MIFQITFTFEDEELILMTPNIIPVSISSVKERNNYQPTVLEDEEKIRVLKKVLKSSTNFEIDINDVK